MYETHNLQDGFFWANTGTPDSCLDLTEGSIEKAIRDYLEAHFPSREYSLGFGIGRTALLIGRIGP